MIVFSNTTPFIALSSINKLELLPKLFGQIHVVTEVIEECAVGGIIPVPDLRTLPWFVEVHSSQAITISILLELDKGEKYTLQMAKEMKADRVIILNKSVGSRFLAQALDSTALQKNTRLTYG